MAKVARGFGVVVVLIGFWPTPAGAQNAITGEAIQTHATFANVGVMVSVFGDDNGNASAALEIEVNDQGFQPAHGLSRSSATSFTGSAFFLPEEAAFEVRVTLSDPDGASNATLTSSGTLRTFAVPRSDGDIIHVSPTGDDDNNDGSELLPFGTVGRGLEVARPGDTVLVHEGVYHEEIQPPRGGTPQAPITVSSAGDGPAVLDGAHPDLKGPSAWTDEGGAIYSAPVGQTRYVAVNGVRLWRYESLADLRSLSEGTDGGFTFEGGRVYVRLPGDGSPESNELQVSTLGRAFWLEGTPNVVIRGLTIRCYGAEEYSEGIMVRDGSHNVWIVDNVFENVMPGVWVKNNVDDLTIADNEFSDRGLAEFPWASVKAQGGMESGAVGVDGQYDGQGIVFYNNIVHDSFDGLNICGDQVMPQPNNADVIGNAIGHLGDDGIETDGECSNVRIMLNRFEDALVGVSVAPAVGGPTYVIRNLMVDLKNVAPDSNWMTRAMKFNVGDPRTSGEIFAYHNTAVTYEADQAAFAVTDDSKWTALHLANNIWVGTDFGFYYSNTGDEPFAQDYDLIFSTGSRLVRFQGEPYITVADYFAATGLCQSCLSADPEFTAGTSGDYTLSSLSPAVDRGIFIAGINDDFAGEAPDIGAYELGGVGPGVPEAGTAARGGNGAAGSGGESADAEVAGGGATSGSGGESADAEVADAGGAAGSGGSGGASGDNTSGAGAHGLEYAGNSTGEGDGSAAAVTDAGAPTSGLDDAGSGCGCRIRSEGPVRPPGRVFSLLLAVAMMMGFCFAHCGRPSVPPREE